MIWNEAVVALFKVLSLHFPAKSVENHDKPQDGQSEGEARTSRLRTRCSVAVILRGQWKSESNTWRKVCSPAGTRSQGSWMGSASPAVRGAEGTCVSFPTACLRWHCRWWPWRHLEVHQAHLTTMSVSHDTSYFPFYPIYAFSSSHGLRRFLCNL